VTLAGGGEQIKIDSQIVFLATSDLHRTADFYEKTLGLPLALDQGKCRIYKVAREAFIGFCERADPPSVDGVIITIVTRQVDEYCDLLRARGVVFEKEPALNADYEIYHCFLRDPNGYLVEIQRFDDPRWANNVEP
jgi:catechol 2,3-dioxygenase-like lactoylglutathione lyase family enzyme